MQKRESVSWWLTAVASVIAIASAWVAYHDTFEEKGEAKSIGTSLLMVIKNTQSGRLASYENIPEDDLSPLEKKRKVILEYDLKNIEQIEQAIGLETPDD
jgi:hypothetical protein